MTVKARPFDVRHEPEDRYDIGWTETRWRLVDEDTGKIVDDAQGWGYKTARNAYRAHAYKKRPKSRRRKAASVKRRVRQTPRETADGRQSRTSRRDPGGHGHRGEGGRGVYGGGPRSTA